MGIATDLLENPEALARAERLMAEVCTGSKLDWLGPVVREHLDAGGKRIRARLALATVAALGGDPVDGIAWASACELLHNASLVHDDLQDGDRYRRGELAVWARHGAAQAINAGDLLLMLPFVAIEQASVDDARKWQLSRLLARGGESIVRGQAAELNLARLGQTSWAAYKDAVLGKTAALFITPVAGAAICAGWSAADADTLGEAVAPLGLGFQIADDLLDLYGDKGREASTDLLEGRVSAIVVHHLALHPEDRDRLLALLRHPRGETSATEVEHFRQCFRTGGAVQATQARLDRIERTLTGDIRLAAAPALRKVVLTLFRLATATTARQRSASSSNLRMQS